MNQRSGSPIHFDWWDQTFLYMTITLTGAAVMMLELLGTRIIGPFYGVSLYVWSALISVTLIALAIGYFLGGYFADHRSGFRFSHAVALGALATLLIPTLTSPVLEASDGLGIRAGAFISALVLFGPSLVCLAMAGPFVIKLCSRQGHAIGTTAGTVFAISTLGSVLGTLFLGFYLLPAFGSRTIVYALGIGLWLLATLISFHEIWRLRIPARPTLIVMSVILLLAGIVTGASWANDTRNKRFRLLFEQESLYGRVRVIDDIYEELRWMLADSSIISGVDLRTGESVLAYQFVASHLPLFRPGAETALLIGLGGGHMVGELERQGIRTDVVEIDPVVSEAARRFFQFTPKGRLWLGDGRYVARKIGRHYDFIIHDCFTGGSEPTHLLSLEMLRTLHEHLKPGGILALNMVGFVSGPQGEAVRAVYRTLAKEFPHQWVTRANPHANFNDIVFLVSDQPLEVTGSREGNVFRQWLDTHRLVLPDDGGFIVTDDYNPLDSLQVGKAEAYRELLTRRIGVKALLW